MTTLERNIERRFRQGVKDAGGWAIKLVGVAGLPDRLVLRPGGRVHFVELKRPGGRVSKIQAAVHRKLTRLGMSVTVVTGKEEVDAWLQAHTTTKN